MSYMEDERLVNQRNKHGFLREIIFLLIMIAIIINRIRSVLDIISLVFLFIVPFVSVIVLIRLIRKKKLSLKNVISGFITGDERIVKIIDEAGNWAVGFGAGALFAYCGYGFIRFSAEKVILEFLFFMVICIYFEINGRFVNKDYIAVTDDGRVEPYYDDDKKKKDIMQKIVKKWIKYAVFFSLLDVVMGGDLFKEPIGQSALKLALTLFAEILICLILAILDILLMKLINKKIYKQME